MLEILMAPVLWLGAGFALALVVSLGIFLALAFGVELGEVIKDLRIRRETKKFFNSIEEYRNDFTDAR